MWLRTPIKCMQTDHVLGNLFSSKKDVERRWKAKDVERLWSDVGRRWKTLKNVYSCWETLTDAERPVKQAMTYKQHLKETTKTILRVMISDGFDVLRRNLYHGQKNASDLLKEMIALLNMTSMIRISATMMNEKNDQITPTDIICRTTAIATTTRNMGPPRAL